MDWQAVGAISGIVSVSLTVTSKWMLTQIDNKILKNNEVLISKMNGTYVRSEALDARLDAKVLRHALECRHSERKG